MRNLLSCFLFAALGGLGCRSQTPGAASPPGSPAGYAPGPTAATVIRIKPTGGAWQVYRTPALTRLTTPTANLPRADRVIGVDVETDALFVLTLRDEVLAVDLLSARIDTVGRQAALATLGPDGTLYVVDAERRVTTLKRRTTRTWTEPLAAKPDALFGAAGQRLLAVVGGNDPRLLVATAEGADAPQPLPPGVVTTSLWGDILALATDTGVALLDPRGRRAPAFVRVRGEPSVAAFSPSGHRLYVGRREHGGLATMDRFTRRTLDAIPLPGPAAALRFDPLGRWLLARPVGDADSLWVVHLPSRTVRATAATSWQRDLPAITADGALLMRRGDDVVAVTPDSLVELGRVAGGASDRWAASAWRPRGIQAQVADAAGDGGAPGSEGPLYVQVSVSQNRAWSTENAQQLTRAGLPASVLPPRSADDGYRVVLGPYASRPEAEAIGRKLGRPFWIFQAGGGP